MKEKNQENIQIEGQKNKSLENTKREKPGIGWKISLYLQFWKERENEMFKEIKTEFVKIDERPS